MNNSNFISSARQSLNLGISLAAATFFGPAIRETKGEDPVAAVKRPATAGELSIPPEIIKTAAMRGISAEHIKLEGNSWVACIERPGQPDTCVPLGKASTPSAITEKRASILQGLRAGDVFVINQYGAEAKEVRIAASQNVQPKIAPELGKLVVHKNGTYDFVPHQDLEARIYRKNGGSNEVIDSLPNYRREAPGVVRTRDLKLVRDYMSSHPDEPMIVIVTVPSHCKPCRQLDDSIKSFVEQKQNDKSLPKIFLLEYFDFETAKKEVVGDKGMFPTILTFAGKDSPERTKWTVVGSASSPEPLLQAVEKNLTPAGRPRVLIQGFFSPGNLQSMLSGMKLRAERRLP